MPKGDLIQLVLVIGQVWRWEDEQTIFAHAAKREGNTRHERARRESAAKALSKSALGPSANPWSCFQESQAGRNSNDTNRRLWLRSRLCSLMWGNRGWGGYGVISALRGDAETATIPFIFLTALAEKL